MTPEQRLNRITSILSAGVIRLVTEAKKQEVVRSQVALMALNDLASPHILSQMHSNAVSRGEWVPERSEHA